VAVFDSFFTKWDGLFYEKVETDMEKQNLDRWIMVPTAHLNLKHEHKQQRPRYDDNKEHSACEQTTTDKHVHNETHETNREFLRLAHNKHLREYAPQKQTHSKALGGME